MEDVWGYGYPQKWQQMMELLDQTRNGSALTGLKGLQISDSTDYEIKSKVRIRIITCEPLQMTIPYKIMLEYGVPFWR